MAQGDVIKHNLPKLVRLGKTSARLPCSRFENRSSCWTELRDSPGSVPVNELRCNSSLATRDGQYCTSVSKGHCTRATQDTCSTS